MNKSYLYIEPYVYCTLKNKQILFYNTLSGDKIIEQINDENLLQLMNMLISKNKFRIVEFEEKNISSKAHEFIDKCKNLFMLDIHYGEKPFIIPSELKVMYDKNYLKSDENNFMNKISPQVHEISIVLGKSTYCNNDILNKNGINQFLFPSDFGKKNNIDAIGIIDSLSKINFNLKSVNIIGDYFRFKDYKILSEYFHNIHISHHSYYLDFEESFFDNKNYKENEFIFLIDFPCDELSLNKMISFLEKKHVNFNFSFIASSNEDITRLEQLNIDNNYKQSIIPFYNKDNINFFKENVFINETDIFEQEIISNKEIFSNMFFNRLLFGKLYFLPDNKIYPNPNFPALGNFKDDWGHLFKKKLLKSDCWFKTRKSTQCSNCIYQYLCPPISNYNLILDKENLCTVCN